MALALWNPPYHYTFRYRSYSRTPRWNRSYSRSSSPPRRRSTPARSALVDKDLEKNGDEGWTLDYATAWLFRHLFTNQVAVTDALDKIRNVDIDDTGLRTPFLIFGLLDRVLFASQLKDMVYLRWKAEVLSSPGTTYGQGIVGKRITIELNKSQFEEYDFEIDDLLDMMIHQMIHAYFLATCAAMQKGEPIDGRLKDGVEFGVILFSIRDISRRCRKGRLDLMFYAEDRRKAWSGGPNYRRQMFLSLNSGSGLEGSEPTDNRSHCCLDNRHVRKDKIKNWQVQKYSVCIDLEFDKRPPNVFDYTAEADMKETPRKEGPPSYTYCVLIWDGKWVMVPRDKAMHHKSLGKPLKKDDKYELKVPKCSLAVFAQLYNFMVKGQTLTPIDDTLMARQGLPGPPVLRSHIPVPGDPSGGIDTLIKLFKVAEEMKFEELEEHVLKQLWKLTVTYDDPIEVLKELYDVEGNNGPVHAELHKWARGFLAKQEFDPSQIAWDAYHHQWSGSSNYEKIMAWHGPRFQWLYQRNAALRDDCRNVENKLVAEYVQPWVDPQDLLSVPQYPETNVPQAIASPSGDTIINVNPRSVQYNNSWHDPADRSPYKSYSKPLIKRRRRSLSSLAAPSPRLLEWTTEPAKPWEHTVSTPYYFGRNGRRKRWVPSSLTGEKGSWYRAPWDRPYARRYSYSSWDG
jgi:hypothetical protein